MHEIKLFKLGKRDWYRIVILCHARNGWYHWLITLLCHDHYNSTIYCVCLLWMILNVDSEIVFVCYKRTIVDDGIFILKRIFRPNSIKTTQGFKHSVFLASEKT